MLLKDIKELQFMLDVYNADTEKYCNVLLLYIHDACNYCTEKYEGIEFYVNVSSQVLTLQEVSLFQTFQQWYVCCVSTADSNVGYRLGTISHVGSTKEVL